MYITAQDVENFIGKYPEDESLAEQYAKAAEEMVAEYLGYSPELKEYTEKRYGDGGSLFALSAFPLGELKKVSADGTELDISRLRIRSKNYLECDFGKGKFSGDRLYEITYTAGYANDEVPAKIRTVALQLASLMWESAGGNLAVSSTSFADTGSRQFNNFTADRFLKELEPFRLGNGGNF